MRARLIVKNPEYGTVAAVGGGALEEGEGEGATRVHYSLRGGDVSFALYMGMVFEVTGDLGIGRGVMYHC